MQTEQTTRGSWGSSAGAWDLPSSMRIVEATDVDMPGVRELFREYQAWLGVDLCFQGFEEELATLPGRYSPPEGVILVAVEEEDFIGCVGIRPRIDNEAELKRLYVKPSQQGRGVGKRLFYDAMSKSEQIGYTSIVLDTLPDMHVAKSLYLAYGFEQIPAYYGNPEEGAEYYRYVFS